MFFSNPEAMPPSMSSGFCGLAVLLSVLVLCSAPLAVLAADVPPNFQTVTRTRLQAAAQEGRANWGRGVSNEAVVVDPSGTRTDAQHWYEQEVQWCKQSHCSPEEFAVKNQANLSVVSYSLLVTTGNSPKLFRCTDTYVNSSGTWRIVSAFQTFVPNARRKRFSIDSATLQSYVGTFSNQSSEKYEVFLTGDRLYARKAGEEAATELIPESATSFYVIGDDRITTFTKTDAGEVTGIKIAGPNSTSTLTKVP
jgi:hypothetical protein